ncbi:hypothetical protein [Flavobacterium urumqiense]|uniref:Uncharacterized protein n=1 Tax=Flavobacterium urumqiense TaxID=935224 RepID=A0A1H5Z9I3_9FLAO|nr:hypothetical protein [Flavobacterium urumqiense]SEG32016.1 hypothetical protein SAMN04488130_109136 [Flavobacterium urumqiense]
MITIIKSPALNRALLDANNTEISISSTNGNGYYFRALIYIDDSLFDEQGWSRKTEFLAVKDLVKLYNAYFETSFAAFTSNGLVEKTNLKKKVSITIEERLLTTDAVVEMVNLPVFYIIYNRTPISFTDAAKIQVLSKRPDAVLIPATGKMIIPIFVNANNETVTVITKNNFGATLNTQTIAAFTGKKNYIYSFDLSGITLASNTIYFETTITCGTTTITLRYRLLRLPDFPVKEIYYKNNFGYFLPAYFDGELEIENSLKIDDYNQADGTSVIFEINEEATYTINTGSLLADERGIVNQIINSYEVYFKVNNVWTKINTKTKKELEFRDKKHSYATDLQFSFVKNSKIANV